MISRTILGIGAAVTAYGVWLLASTGLDNVLDAAVWLAAGVLLHDAVLAPAVAAVSVLALGRWGAPLACGLVLLGTLTLTAVPVLSGRGVRADNPTLLDRDYWGGWLLVAATVCAVVLLMRVRQRRE